MRKLTEKEIGVNLTMKTYTHKNAILRATLEGLRPGRIFQEPLLLMRVAVAIFIATFLGLLIGNVKVQNMFCVGAFLSGIGTLIPHRRNRIKVSFISAVLIMLSLFIGIFLHNQPLILYPLLFVLVFISGMLRKISIGMGMRSLIFTISMVASSEISTSIEVGLSILIFGGVGVLITVLCQLIPPYEPRFFYQRKNISAFYKAIAYDACAIAEERLNESSCVFAAHQARNALALLPESQRTDANFLFSLVAEGERIGTYLHSMEMKNDYEIYKKKLKKVGELLNTISTEILNGRSMDSMFEKEIKEMLMFLRGEQIRDDICLEDEISILWVQQETLVSNLKKLSSELHWHSPVFCHAIRLAIFVTLAQFLGSIFGNWGNLGISNHGFWLSLTTAVVLFPNYRETFSRGIGRTVGTIIGAFVGCAISVLPTNQLGHTIILVLLLFGYLAFRSAGQPWLIMWVVAWIVNLGGGSAAAFTRSINTIIGAGVAMIAYSIWPTWNTDQIHRRLFEWILIEGKLIRLLTIAWSNPACSNFVELNNIRHEARVAHRRLEETITNAKYEPVFIRSKWNESELGQLRLAVHEVSRQISVLNVLFHEKTNLAQPVIDSYGEKIETYMNWLADIVITGKLNQIEYDYVIENLKLDMNIINKNINPRVGNVFNLLILDIKTLTLAAKVYNYN